MSTREPSAPHEILFEEPTAPSSPPARRAPSFAVDWDRYELLNFLGKGGMGSVYRARDKRLDRIVAIKFVLGADPKMTTRFLYEARAQSRVDHPNICRVYEVGEVAGRAYIALQFVRGEPLHRVAKQLSLDEKVTVMRDIASAVHEAHRLSIVHRDLKPSNVLVERTEDGRWFPVVMDFGLARELSVDPSTADSEVVQGTPAYMSPEQVRGDASAIDRRSDVYSLGATLYELMTGQVPFAETSMALILTRLMNEEPPPPRDLVPDLPTDLEIIILQCLAKDPAHRYPSARALADDLDRYLDGEPIQGRQSSPWRRARMFVRHHPVLTSVGTSMLVFLVIILALSAHAQRLSREARERADKRTCLAQRIGEEATRIEGSLHEAYLRPLHDVRPDRQRAREQLRRVEAVLHDPSDPGGSYAHAALGRGHLALHEWNKAVDDLQAAQRAGLDTPDLHAALGRAFGELYFRAQGEVGHPTDAKDAATWLAERRTSLMKKYLEPARHELELSGDKNRLSRIRISLYTQDFSTAEQQAREVTDEDPDALEAREIVGEAAFLAASEAFDHGNYDAALPMLERAADAYSQAILVARSDGSLYRAAAEAWLQIAEIEHRRRRSPLASLQRAIDLLEHGALVADPDDATSHVTRAYVLLRWYRSNLVTPADEISMIDRIVGSAARAVAIDTKDARALTALGVAYIYRGSYEFFHGGQGTAWWHRATSRLEESLAILPDDPRSNNALGLAHRWLGDALDKVGRDPSQEYDAARRSYELAIAIDPGYLRACINRTELSTLSAEHDTMLGRDPLPAVTDARQAGRRCLAVEPTSYAILDVLARAELALAQHLLETDGDPIRALSEARDLLDQSEAGLPDHTELWFLRGVAARLEAAHLSRHAKDPTEAITRGRLDLGRALHQMPNSARAYVELTRLDLIDATRARPSGIVAPILDDARRCAEKAVELDARLPWAHLVAAEVYLRLAMLSTPRGTRALIERGIVHADDATQLFPGIPGGRDTREALDHLRKQ